MTTATHSVDCEYSAMLQTATYALDSFKASVRDSFIDFAELHDVDTDDANAFLEGLGLEGIESEFPVTASFTYTIELTVKARNVDSAYEIAKENLYDIAPQSIRIESTDAIESGSAFLQDYDVD
jgi:hypothetical protein